LEFEGKQFSDFKSALTDMSISILGPIGAEMARLMSDPGYLDIVLRDGAEKSRIISDEVISEVYDVVGLLRV
jgi:tryptophanyl-tRNA synthetase